MVQTTKTISFETGLDKGLDEVLVFLNANQITGAITKSKLIRLAVYDYIEKIKRMKNAQEKDLQLNQTAEQFLNANAKL